MNKNKRYTSIFLVLLIFSILVTPFSMVKAIPSDDYRLQVGDWFVMEYTYANDTAFPVDVGDQFKASVSMVNQSNLDGYIGSVLHVDIYNKSAGSSTFEYLKTSAVGVYNSTDTNLTDTNGYYFAYSEALFVGIISCSNLDGGIAQVASWLPYNSTNGNIITIWEGYANGTAYNVSEDSKLIISFETTKNVMSSMKYYEWNGTDWSLGFIIQLVDYSWMPNDSPNLFLLIFIILIVLLSISVPVAYHYLNKYRRSKKEVGEKHRIIELKEKSSRDLLSDIYNKNKLLQIFDSERKPEEFLKLDSIPLTTLDPQLLEKVDLLDLSDSEKLSFLDELRSLPLEMREDLIDFISKTVEEYENEETEGISK